MSIATNAARRGAMPLSIAFGLASVLALSPGDPPAAQTAVNFSAPGFVSEVVIAGQNSQATNNYVGFAFTPTGDKVFLAHKFGRIGVAVRNPDGTYTPNDQSFGIIDYDVNNISDRGLLSVAVHPEWPAQPFVYALYTYDPPEIQARPAGGLDGPDGRGARVSRLVRIAANPDTDYERAVFEAGGGNRPAQTVILGSNSTFANMADPTQPFSATLGAGCEQNGEPVVDCLSIESRTHTIGMVRFGPDGMLWVSNGDGAEYDYVDAKALRSLDLDSLAGKIMRIDPETGLGLPDNPFYDGNPSSNRSRVVSYGLRNPFRFTIGISGTTGELFSGDVGWNVWEEINRGNGQNFGWPCYEGAADGNLQQPAYRDEIATAARCAEIYANAAQITAPLYSYEQIDKNGAAMVGDFYTGTNFPLAYRGALFVGDYALSRIQYITFDSAGRPTINDFATNLAPNGGAMTQLSMGPDGFLYYIVFNGANSELRRIRHTGDNTPPSVQARADVTNGLAPLSVNFTATGSDADGDALTYSWLFGDGSNAVGATVGHTYASNGVYTATVTASDGKAGGETSANVVITVGNRAPEVAISAPLSGTTYLVDQDVITLTATLSDSEDGSIPPERIVWEAILHHDSHTHSDEGITIAPDGLSATIAPGSHGDATYTEICLTAFDSGGLSNRNCIDLRPAKVAYTFESVPPGLLVIYEGEARQTPFTVQTNQNQLQQVIAPPIQNGIAFSRWTNDGVGSSAATLSFRNTTTAQTVTVFYLEPSIYIPLVAE